MKRYKNTLNVTHPLMVTKQEFHTLFKGHVDVLKRRQALRNMQMVDMLYMYSRIERMTLGGEIHDVDLGDVLEFMSDNLEYISFPEKSRETETKTAMQRYFEMCMERTYKLMKMSEEEFAAHKEKIDKQYEEQFQEYDMLNLLGRQDLIDYRGQSYGNKYIDTKIVDFAKIVGTPVVLENMKMTLGMACDYDYTFETLHDNVEGFVLFASAQFKDVEFQLTYWDMNDEEAVENKTFIRCLNGKIVESTNSNYEPNNEEEYILRVLDALR